MKNLINAAAFIRGNTVNDKRKKSINGVLIVREKSVLTKRTFIHLLLLYWYNINEKRIYVIDITFGINESIYSGNEQQKVYYNLAGAKAKQNVASQIFTRDIPRLL